jgi:hypothetical protein
MRKTIFLLFIINIIFIPQLKAQDSGFGIGIIAGEPTGLSGKLWLGGNNALDMAAAWSLKVMVIYYYRQIGLFFKVMIQI